jgi:hypothetical protein
VTLPAQGPGVNRQLLPVITGRHFDGKGSDWKAASWSRWA